MQLAALSAGGHAPRSRFNGAVHSVFRQACNIRLDDSRMLALLAPYLGNVPQGVRLDVPTAFAFADHLTVGQRVGCRADVLRAAGGGLSVDLGTAQPWRGELPAGGVNLAVPKVVLAWRTAWHAWQHGRPLLDQAEVRSLSRAVNRQGVRLARAARVLQPDEAARALDRLIGCGPGLTPSGDDLIVGFLAGLWSTTGHDRARRAFLGALCAGVAAAAAATGDVSRAYLTHAAQGRFAEPLITLARQVGEGADCGAIERATVTALRVGHTSGADSVFGLLLGLAVWAPQLALSTLARQTELIAGSSLVEPGHDGWKSRAIACSATGFSGQPDGIGRDPATHSLFPRDYRPTEVMDAPTPVGRWVSDTFNAMLAEC